MQIFSPNYFFTILTASLLVFACNIASAFKETSHPDTIYPTFLNGKPNDELRRDTLRPDSISTDSTGNFRATPQDSRPIFNYKNVKKYIFSNLYYPQEAQQEKIEGKVLIHFCIQENGKINEIKITKNVHPLLDSAALQLIRNMPQWQPIIHQGIPQRISYTIPIEFELKD